MALSRQQVTSIIVEAAQRYGVDPQAMLAIAKIESNFKPDAKNPRSSAGGLFQFIDSTWNQYGGKNASRYDARTAADAAARLTRDNQKALERGLGRSVTSGELYLAHQQGVGGALNLLRNPDQPVSKILGRDAIMLNGGKPNMTAGQFAQLWTGKADKAAGQMQESVRVAEAPIPQSPINRDMAVAAINTAAPIVPAGLGVGYAGVRSGTPGSIQHTEMSLPNSPPAFPSLPPSPMDTITRSPTPAFPSHRMPNFIENPLSYPNGNPLAPDRANPAPVGRVTVSDLPALPSVIQASAPVPQSRPTMESQTRGRNDAIREAAAAGLAMPGRNSDLGAMMPDVQLGNMQSRGLPDSARSGPMDDIGTMPSFNDPMFANLPAQEAPRSYATPQQIEAATGFRVGASKPDYNMPMQPALQSQAPNLPMADPRMGQALQMPTLPQMAPIPMPTIDRPGMFDFKIGNRNVKLPGLAGLIQGIAHTAANAKGSRSSGFENMMVNVFNPGIQSSQDARDYARSSGDHSGLSRGDRSYDPDTNSWDVK